MTYNNLSLEDSPYGLKLQQTFTSSGAVTIPAGVRRVYAIVVGGGGGGFGTAGANGGGGGAGGYSAGWTYPATSVVVGTGGAGGTTGVII